ncbi:FxsA family protein [Haloactinopolyspora sp.]|uniref:FxsA family protein n=1 Tax=Haloactinopolyspora sp. TaxID=1966353 RepID=UPI002614F005|nr:FxsA family protein [Haloactinopolyspora sp.]
MNTTGRGLRGFGPFAIGVLELVALVMVARWIGFGWALLLLLSTSVIGLAVLRFEGFRAWASLREAVAQGRFDDTEEAAAGASERIAGTGVRMLAGVMLTLPGFVTDICALVLLIPPVRKSVGRRLSAAALRTFPSGRPPGGGGVSQATRHGPVIEGEVVDSRTPDDPTP